MEKVIIIGAGPAGISAALYAVRGNLDPLVINNGIGALEKAEKRANYSGLEHPLSGQELYDTGIAQAKALGVRILDAQVLGVGGFDTFVVKTTEGEFETQSLILATGSKRAAPKIPGVKEFEGKGVSYCAICDAFFYRGKDVAVLGNGDFAMHEAKELSNTASTVTIYTNGEEPEFTPEENISVNTMKIQSVEGDDLVSGIRLAPDVQAQEINGEAGQQVNDFCPADGVFIAMGTAGSTEIARQMGATFSSVLGVSNFAICSFPLLLLSFLNLFFTSETAGSSTILIWLLTSTPFDFRNSITSLFCRPSSLASSCTLNFDNRYTSFMIAFAKFSSWTARQARYSFPIALPKLSLSEKKKIGTS